MASVLSIAPVPPTVPDKRSLACICASPTRSPASTVLALIRTAADISSKRRLKLRIGGLSVLPAQHTAALPSPTSSQRPTAVTEPRSRVCTKQIKYAETRLPAVRLKRCKPVPLMEQPLTSTSALCDPARCILGPKAASRFRWNPIEGPADRLSSGPMHPIERYGLGSQFGGF
jgi:hypothetical protein